MKGRFWKMKNVPLRVDISNARPRFWLAHQWENDWNGASCLSIQYLWHRAIILIGPPTQSYWVHGGFPFSPSKCMTRPLVKHYYWLANQSNTIGVCTPMKAVTERAETGFTIAQHSPCGMTVVPQSAKDLFSTPLITLSMSWLH